jgi:hypothetical protein
MKPSLLTRRLFWQLRTLIAAVGLLVAASPSARAALPPGNAVQQWNRIAEDTVVASGAFQNEGLIYMAYVSAAVYDAVVAIDGSGRPYGSRLVSEFGASLDAAVVEAAFAALRNYFPAQAISLDALHTEALAAVPDGRAKDSGRAVGAAAAADIILRRANDGRVTPVGASSAFPKADPDPGVWRLTPPFLAPQTPWVGSVTPFVLKKPGQFHPHPPPSLASRSWVDQFNEVRDYGSAISSVRDAGQTAIARFWTANVIRQFNRLGRDLSSNRSLDLPQTARLLAMINVVGADAQIAVMHWKYEFLFWRPVTAIDQLAVTADGFGPVPGFDDGNGDTIEEAGWRPLLTTPNHPEYPGAHGSITSAVTEILTEFFGTDRIDVDIHGFDPNGATGNLDATRHFDMAAQLRDEIVGARLWAGLHYRGSTEAGVWLGRKVARYDLHHAFKLTR